MEWKPSTLDLQLSAIIALGFPFLANFLYSETGALIPLILYYGLAWGVVKLRRGKTGYFNPITKIPRSFYINVGVIIISLIFAYQARIISIETTTIGILLTALIWAPVNAASEQLLWIYIFESWDLYPSDRQENSRSFWGYRVLGLLFFTAFVGLIHTLFWLNFLHTVNSKVIFGVLFVLATTISGYFHPVVWRQSNQMIFTFIPHLLLNLLPTFWTMYSILPYLLN